ncbi:DUF3168 domain-containing protein [Actinocorallia sp. API 0066]|uniref:DUF3168 domain-containing protein n=1 Tax=Actinocorallia sp. API 0066 TaxID=2896846 RepID=UPI001E31E8D0|nr:DUF3168 domain-containing protein [Actinocorallia sp. API 0066]MCD0450767.1 DUF3168 domain-containing protein [Actinocorallia sp. API 0066]
MNATSPMGAVQQAVYNRLTADTMLGHLVTGVYDEVPEGTSFPYVVLGESMEQPDNRHGGFGRQTVETLHVWWDRLGMAQGKAIMSRLVALLDHQPLIISGLHHVATRYEFAQVLRDPNPKLRHGIQRYRIFTEQEP